MIFIISAPSGAGKSTLINYLLQKRSDLEFSVSATTRPPRPNELNGKDYYFISPQEFETKIANNEFIEYEFVYKGIYYGTLRSEIERIEKRHHHIIFEVDVKGGLHLKEIFCEGAVSIFIMPPSLEELRRRLERRHTESDSDIEERVTKAALEMQDAKFYDVLIVNKDIDEARQKLLAEVDKWTHKNVK